VLYFTFGTLFAAHGVSCTAHVMRSFDANLISLGSGTGWVGAAVTACVLLQLAGQTWQCPATWGAVSSDTWQYPVTQGKQPAAAVGDCLPFCAGLSRLC
jgi:hypothetical protein